MALTRAVCGCLLLAAAAQALSIQPLASRGMHAAPSNSLMRSVALQDRAWLCVSMGPAPQIAKPKTQIKHATYTGSPGGPGGGKPGGAAVTAKAKPKQITEDMPLWKVILLGDEDYEEEPVCDALVRVIPEVANVMQAKEKYNEAQLTGKALLIVVPKEHAELYKEQLQREDPMVFADIEED